MLADGSRSNIFSRSIKEKTPRGETKLDRIQRKVS
jgi:hypothetical protein